MREIPLDVQVTGPVFGNRNQLHDEPVGGEQGDDPDDLPAHAGGQVNSRCDQVTDGDSLQDSHGANGRVKLQDAVVDKAEGEQEHHAAEDAPIELRIRNAFFALSAQGERNSNSGHEDEEREDQVIEVEPFPLHMIKLLDEHKAELPRVRYHDLRHSHATMLLRQGIHPKVVSERLCHSTTGITLDIYSHVMPGMQEEAAQKVDVALRTAIEGAA